MIYLDEFVKISGNYQAMCSLLLHEVQKVSGELGFLRIMSQAWNDGVGQFV